MYSVEYYLFPNIECTVTTHTKRGKEVKRLIRELLKDVTLYRKHIIITVRENENVIFTVDRSEHGYTSFTFFDNAADHGSV